MVFHPYTKHFRSREMKGASTLWCSFTSCLLCKLCTYFNYAAKIMNPESHVTTVLVVGEICRPHFGGEDWQMIFESRTFTPLPGKLKVSTPFILVYLDISSFLFWIASFPKSGFLAILVLKRAMWARLTTQSLMNKSGISSMGRNGGRENSGEDVTN